MKIYYPISVDLYKQYPLEIVTAQQANIGRGVMLTLTVNNAVIIPENESLYVYIKKPDGTKIYTDCTLEENKVRVDFPQQMLTSPGMLEAELQMIDADGNNITTPIFLIDNQRSNIDYAELESSNEFKALVDALSEVEYYREHGLVGPQGKAATIQIGDVTASDPGSNPQVTNSGTEQDAVLNFVLPRGQQGPEGPPGPTQVTFGAYSSFPGTGQANMLYVDNTVNPALEYVWDGSEYVPAGGGIPASSVAYNNESGGLTAQTVQEAIDENAQNISSLNSSLRSESRKSRYNARLIDSMTSLKSVIVEFVSGNNLFCVLILNNPQENVFGPKGLNTGILLLFYSNGYWNGHPNFMLIKDDALYTGTLDAVNNTLDIIYKHSATNWS